MPGLVRYRTQTEFTHRLPFQRRRKMASSSKKSTSNKRPNVKRVNVKSMAPRLKRVKMSELAPDPNMFKGLAGVSTDKRTTSYWQNKAVQAGMSDDEIKGLKLTELKEAVREAQIQQRLKDDQRTMREREHDLQRAIRACRRAYFAGDQDKLRQLCERFSFTYDDFVADIKAEEAEKAAEQREREAKRNGKGQDRQKQRARRRNFVNKRRQRENEQFEATRREHLGRNGNLGPIRVDPRNEYGELRSQCVNWFGAKRQDEITFQPRGPVGEIPRRSSNFETDTTKPDTSSNTSDTAIAA